MNIIRAWKDKEYRMSLSDEELSLLPDNPAGPMELSDDLLESIVGGHGGNGNHNHSNDDSNDDSTHGGDSNSCAQGVVNVPICNNDLL
jgi:mersacidin/lichenicidin family type 2 lantibiotic